MNKSILIALLSSGLALASIISDGTVATDSTTGLMWQDGYKASLKWGEAIGYCEALSLGGYSDWRLPNIKELQSIIDRSRYPAIKSGFVNPSSIEHWSSTTYPLHPDYAFLVYFSNGYSYARQKSYSPLVRCVRLGQ